MITNTKTTTCTICFFFCLTAISCNRLSSREKNYSATSHTSKQKSPINYDLGCLRDSSIADGLIGIGSQIEDDIILKSTANVPIADEKIIGDTVYNKVLSQHRLISEGIEYERILRISKKLISHIDSPKGFSYEFYLVDADEVNAFTAGGKIFVYKGILKYIESDDELACVIGHEIFHNELGHINKKIRKQLALKKLLNNKRAKYAGFALIIFGASFNQDEETLCDLHGIDLAQKSGYKGCSAIAFWKRVSKKEHATVLAKMLRSHPYGKQRMNCIKHHIDINYNIQCSE
jgi:predicted Zn-dependent protease